MNDISIIKAAAGDLYSYSQAEKDELIRLAANVIDGQSNQISELEEEVKTLERKVKKAFWWSAEFTQVAYGGRIQAAWEYYKEQD